MNSNALTQVRWNAIGMIAVVVMISGAPLLRAAAPAVAGEQRRWAVAFRSRLEQAGSVRPVEVDLNGDWISSVSAVRSDGYDVQLQLANVHLGGTVNAPASQVDQFSQRLQRPFWATYHADGSLVDVYFYKDTDPGDRNLLQMIATESQFVNASGNQQSWTVLERDGAGQYTALYRRDGANHVTKQKLNYTRTDGTPEQTAGAVRISIDQSDLRFTLDADGGVSALDATDRVRLAVSFGNGGSLAAITETHLSSPHKAQAPEVIGSLARALPEVMSSPVETHRQDPQVVRARLDAQLLEGRTAESLLHAALPGTVKSAEDPSLGDRLAALFRQRPEAPAAAVNLLRQNGPVKKITDALGTAGSPAATSALGIIARDRSLPRPLRIDALTALMLNQHPTVDAMRVPAFLIDDGDATVASAARIASGALARAARTDHPDEAAKIDAALVTRYRQARDPKELCDLLAALGNSASDSAAPVIEGALHDPSNAVRNAAAGALRLVSGPEIDGLLSTAIANDGDAEVRASAIFAAGFHHPNGPKVIDSLVHAAKTDPADHVRVAAITLLQKNPQVVPELHATLAWIAEHDPKPGVRRLAQDALRK